jgi:hypothetical protein
MGGRDRNSSRRQVLFGKYDANPTAVDDDQFAPIQVDQYGNLKSSATVPVYATRLDEASATVTYVGNAVVGSLDADPVWQIKKITESGTITKIEFAEGEQTFDKVWADRAALSYS